jgi:hypothetical protein
VAWAGQFDGSFWEVVLIAPLMALMGGGALMQSASGTGGNALGQGISGAFTFVVIQTCMTAGKGAAS